MNQNPYAQPQYAPLRRTPARRSNRTLWLIAAGALALFGTLFVIGVAFLFLLTLLPTRIPAGVSIASVTIGGKTAADATSTLQQQLPAQTLTLTDGSRSWPISAADLGIGIDLQNTVKAAEAASANQHLLPVYTIDLTKAQAGFVALSDQINIAAAPGKDGRAMDIPVMLDRLRVDVAGEIADGVLDLNMIITPAPTPQTTSNYTGATTTYTVQQGQELGLIAKDYNVSIQDIMALNDISNPDVIYPGQELTIPAAGEYVPEAPAAPTNVGRSIVVSTENQRIYAYQDGQVVRTHLVSTGLPDTPTVHGDFKVYVKYTATDMSGPGYYLPQVPYTMYFYQGYGIHGTYWHNAFGRPMSHGCVNLPTDEAQWFFDFATVGTPVRVV